MSGGSVGHRFRGGSGVYRGKEYGDEYEEEEGVSGDEDGLVDDDAHAHAHADAGAGVA